MLRPLALIVAFLSCLLLAGIASAQVERDTNSRSRAGYSGVSRDVFTRGRSGPDEQSAPVEEFQISPYFEATAISISFSIKGAARDVAAIIAVSRPEPPVVADTPAAAALDEQEIDSVEELAGQLAEKLSGLDQFTFGDFPESAGGTLHDLDDNVAEATAEEQSSGVEEQLDQPSFLHDDPAEQLQQAIQEQAADVPAGEPRAPLSADGKGAIAFGDGTSGFAIPELPDQADFALPDGGDEQVQLSLPTHDWGGIRIPSSVTELSRGNKKKRQVALTFDDGPHPEYTEQLLSILDYYDVPATFFFVGIQCVKYPQLVQEAYDAGHEIGSQTYDHFRLPQLPKDEKEYQIDEYQLLIKRLVGTEPKFLRPPGGQVDDQTRALLKQRGIILGMWDVALNDTKDGKTAAEMLATAKSRVRPGSVILAHDGVAATVELLPQLIEELRRQGYEFVTMSQLAADL